jgi:hypothetical protein
MSGPKGLRMVEMEEVIQDPINGLDDTEAGRRTLEPKAKRDLLTEAHRDYEQVARRHRIPELDFQAPLLGAVMSIRHESSF